MRKLTAKSQKTLSKLEAKADFFSVDNVRMPSIKLIAELLSELNKDFFCTSMSCEKHTKAVGMQYTTGGGSKVYNGSLLSFKLNGMKIELDSTDSYYSYQTRGYAQDLIKFINE